MESTPKPSLSRTSELSTAWFEGLSDAAAGVIVHLSGSGQTTYVSRSITGVLGWDPKEARTRSLFGLIEESDHEAVRTVLVRAHAAEGREISFDFKILHLDGRFLFAHGTAVRAAPPDGGSPGILLRFLDVTEVRQREARLAEHARWLHKLTRNSGEVITVLDVAGRHAFVGGSAEELVGWDPEGWTAERWRESIHEQDRGRALATLDAVRREAGSSEPFQYRLRRKNGQLIHVETLAVNLVDDPDLEGCVLYTRDITRQVVQDALTGLPNRLLFDERVRSAFTRAPEQRRDLFGIVLLRVDRYEMVSAGLGPGPADQLLLRFGERIAELVAETDLLARYSTDVFAVLLHDLPHEQAMQDFIGRVMASLDRPFNLWGQDVHTGVAVGAALSDQVRASMDVMFQDAERSLSRSFARRRTTTGVDESQVLEEMTSRLELEAELRRGLKEGQLDVHYQPVVSLRSGALAGFEALVRWNHPTRGLIGPNRFIPLAEETELIGLIGAHVLSVACRQLASWQASSDRAHDLWMSVNVSAREFQGDLVDRVVGVLQDNGLAPAHLKLEVTETALIGHPAEAARTLDLLSGMGVLLALDDFGTGYASLGALNRYAFHTLKIDRSFVSGPEGMEATGRSLALVRTIVQMARALGLQVVAEGIETRRQAELLQSMRCSFGQGYFFARPLTADAARHVIETSRA